MHKLYVPKSIINNPKEVSVYCHTFALVHSSILEEYCVHYKTIQYLCGFDPRHELDNMIDAGVLHARNESGLYIVYRDSFDHTECIGLYYEYINRIRNDRKIIGYYAKLVSLLDDDCGYMSYDYIMLKTGISKATISKYNKILEDIGALSVKHNHSFTCFANLYTHIAPDSVT